MSSHLSGMSSHLSIWCVQEVGDSALFGCSRVARDTIRPDKLTLPSLLVACGRNFKCQVSPGTDSYVARRTCTNHGCVGDQTQSNTPFSYRKKSFYIRS
jgi:hypothetical protein